MTYISQCPIPAMGGRDCWQEPHPGNRFGICIDHWRMIVDEWMQDEPAVRVRCGKCASLVNVDPAELRFAVCEACHEKMTGVGVAHELVKREVEARGRGVVYYMRFGQRVKIGYTTNLIFRVTQIPNDEVVAAEPGDYALERRRHREFAPEIVEGHREWFEMSPRLGFHLANVRDRYGEPFALASEVTRGAVVA